MKSFIISITLPPSSCDATSPVTWLMSHVAVPVVRPSPVACTSVREHVTKETVSLTPSTPVSSPVPYRGSIAATSVATLAMWVSHVQTHRVRQPSLSSASVAERVRRCCVWLVAQEPCTRPSRSKLDLHVNCYCTCIYSVVDRV